MSEENSVKIDVYNKAIDQAAEEVQGWIDLHIKKHTMLTNEKAYSDQISADREHGNTLRLLQVIKNKILKKKLKDQQ